MPYKDIENRRKCWKRWKLKNSEKHKENSKRQKQAARLYPIRQECSIDNCDNIGERHHPDNNKPKEIAWLCKRHHEDFHIKPIRYCKIDFCKKIHHAKGFCNVHLKQWQKGKLDSLPA